MGKFCSWGKKPHTSNNRRSEYIECNENLKIEKGLKKYTYNEWLSEIFDIMMPCNKGQQYSVVSSGYFFATQVSNNLDKEVQLKIEEFARIQSEFYRLFIKMNEMSMLYKEIAESMSKEIISQIKNVHKEYENTLVLLIHGIHKINDSYTELTGSIIEEELVKLIKSKSVFEGLTQHL